MAHLSRRQFLKTSSALPGVMSLGGGCTGDPIRPNILVILLDQMSGRSTDFSGTHRWLDTPAMDALAASGTYFSESYCTYPLCSPSRSSLFTGRYVHETGVIRNANDHILTDGIPRMGDIFQAAGYRTAYFGKDHGGGAGATAFRTQGSPKQRGVNGDGMDPVWRNECVAFLRASPRQPFLAVVSLLNPHDICGWVGAHNEPQDWPDTDNLPPLLSNFHFDPTTESEYDALARAGWGENFRTEQAADWGPDQFRAYLKAYYAWIATVDREVGILLEGLRHSGLSDNTLVVLLSDHGDGMGAHHFVTKPHMSEETIRVPFLMVLPGYIPAGVVDRTHLVSGVDLLPTLCDYANIPIPAGVRGSALRQIIEAPESDWRDYVVIQDSGARAMRIGTYKYVRYAYGARPEALFNLQIDPGEMGNLIHDAMTVNILTTCRARLDQWMHETGDDFTITNVPQRNTLPPG